MRASAGALTGGSGEAGQALGASSTVGLRQFFAAEPERSTALADFQFQEQIVHFFQFSRAAVAQLPSSFSVVERGRLVDFGKAPWRAEGALAGSCGRTSGA